MPKFQRIYWLEDFNWKEYASLYNAYCQTKQNYYQQTAEALLSAIRISQDAQIVDAGAGTGALTSELMRRMPHAKIFAIDLSSEMLHYYKKRFKKQIAKRQIKVIQGNVENINKYVRNSVDIIFVASALWDIELSPFFKNARKILRPNGKIVFNLPALVLGETKGFIGFIEKSVRKEMPGKQLYRRIILAELTKIFRQNSYTLEKQKHFRFTMSKSNVAKFFKVLRYRYPFILFPKKLSYKERFKLCTKIFNTALKKMPSKGISEEGYVFVIGKA